MKKIIFGIRQQVLADDLVIMCDEIIEETKAVPIIFNEKLAFLLITIALLIAVSTYCYLIKYQAKQKIFIIVSPGKNE